MKFTYMAVMGAVALSLSTVVSQEIGGEVGGGRQLKWFTQTEPTEDAAQKAAITAKVAGIRANGEIPSNPFFTAADFTHGRTKVVYFDLHAGTNTTVAASEIEFTVMSTDVSNNRSNLWADTITFDVSDGYSTETFVGEKPDGSLHPTQTPTTAQSKRITGALELKFLSQTDDPTLSWFNAYVGSFPNLEIRVKTKIKGVAMPDFVLRKSILGLAAPTITIAANGDVSLKVEENLNDSTSYMLQTTTTVADPSSWQDVRSVSQGETISLGNVSDGAMKFARIVYKP